MSHSQNAILASLRPHILETLAPYLSSVAFEPRRIIVDSRQHVSRAVFPHGGVLSCVVETVEGTGIETAMIGRDGVFGALHSLDHKKSINKVMVQAPFSASVIDPAHLKAFAYKLPELREVLVRYEQLNIAQIQQTAACNALHSIEQRACKWLVRMHDLVVLTQDFLAQMMGVRRTSVTTIASKLQQDGLIAYTRGKMRIADLPRLRKSSCECAEIVRESYFELVGLLVAATR